MILRRGGKNTQKDCTKKGLNDPDNHDGVITHLEPDSLECDVKWALGSITTNKTGGGEGLPVQFSSVTQSCPTLCNPKDRSTPGFPVHHQLPEFKLTSFESVMPSSHLSLCHTLLLPPSIFPSIRVFSKLNYFKS